MISPASEQLEALLTLIAKGEMPVETAKGKICRFIVEAMAATRGLDLKEVVAEESCALLAERDALRSEVERLRERIGEMRAHHQLVYDEGQIMLETLRSEVEIDRVRARNARDKLFAEKLAALLHGTIEARG